MTPQTRRDRAASGLAMALLAWCVGCESRLVLGAGCTATSECAAPLVCRFERCRTECTTARDCPLGTVCIEEAGLGACRLPAESACASEADCPGALICALGACRNRCVTVDDCAAGSACVPDPLAGTVCVDPGDAPDGGVLSTDATRETTLTFVVARDIDDGMIEARGGLLPMGEALNDFFGATDAGLSYAYFTFDVASAVPAGATIQQATLRLYGRGIFEPLCGASDEMVLVAADTNTARPPASVTDYAGGATGPAATSASVSWGPITAWRVDEWNESPNTAAIVQELVDDHGGLSVGSAVQLWAAGGNFANHDCEWGAEDYARLTANHAELIVRFTR